MATAYYTPEPAGSSGIQNLDNHSEYLATYDGSQSVSMSMPHADAIPPPNPQFVFPAAPPSPTPGPASANPATRRRRPLSAVETHTRSFSLAVDSLERIPRHAALPEFSFNPGASLPAESRMQFLLSPPVSPNTPRTTPSSQRPAGHGHRRGGSEFVGGRLREGNTILSGSPPKAESGFPASLQLPPPGRRGHRRGVSGAISTNDLPLIPPPSFNDMVKGSSAPNSPTVFEKKDDLPILHADDSVDLMELPEPANSVRPLPTAENPTPPQTAEGDKKDSKPATRARVGFSDTLEYIPRPLSLISSDTSSTATAKPGHSVSGSISSVISGAMLSGRESPAPLSRVATSELMDSRPSTANAVLQRPVDVRPAHAKDAPLRRRNSIPAMIDVTDNSTAPPAPSPTRPKRWSFFGLEPFVGSGSPSKARPGSAESADVAAKQCDSGSYSDHGSDVSLDAPDAGVAKPKKSGKRSSKKKKVKGWAGSILPKKPKSQKKQPKLDATRPPTPPASASQHEEEEYAIEEGYASEPELATPTVTITESPALPQQSEAPARREEVSSPMIDLDAALGPFNTPLQYNPEWEAAQRAAGNNKRRLHSAQGMRGFSGPGMHYHRRAESAPALPPFDAGRSVIHRFGSNSTMADVFEEDEEDEGHSAASHSDDEGSDGEATPPATLSRKEISLPELHDKPQRIMRRWSSGLSDRDHPIAHSIGHDCSSISLHDDVIVEEHALSRGSDKNTQGSRSSLDVSASSPQMEPGSNDPLPNDDHLANVAEPLISPITPYSMSQSSSHPSPRSPISIDAQRISTAPSSITDGNSFHSLLMGEPGPEVRVSMDFDIPSLTPTTSTATRDSTFIPAPRVGLSTLRDQRPVSVSSSAFGRRRSSLVSLSRLISSSHGERSKLSTEMTADSEPEQKKTKSSKTKRLSRMMQFWKPSKDGAATT